MRKRGRRFKDLEEIIENDVYVPQKRNLFKALNRVYKKKKGSDTYRKLIKSLTPAERKIIDLELDFCRYPKDWPVINKKK